MHVRLLLVIGLAIPPCGGSAHGQTREATIRESVVLETDSAVVRQLGSVRDYLSEKQWDQAIGILQQIADMHGRKLIAAQPGRYVSVRRQCNVLLASLPPEGLAVFRKRIDSRSREWYETGRRQRDEAQLMRVLEHAFASSDADDALFLLGELAWARADYDRAREFWSQILPADRTPGVLRTPSRLHYPDTTIDPSKVRARLILCSIAENNLTRAREELKTFQEAFPDARGTLAGKTGLFSQLLADVLRDASSWSFPVEPASASTFAFNERRNGIVPRAVEVGSVLWSAPLADVDLNNPGRDSPPFRSPPLSWHPVTFGESLLVANSHSISAFDLTTGRPSWPAGADTSALIYPTLPDPRPPVPLHPVAGIPQYTMTVHGGRLYARIGVPIVRWARHEFRVHSELVCLDLEQGEGRLVWKVDANKFGDEESIWSVCGSPIVDAGRVYVALQQSFPAAQVNIACLSAETGRPLWNRKICNVLLDVDAVQNVLGNHLLTLGNHRLYLSTNLGAVAALALDSGDVEWIVTYPSQMPSDDVVVGDDAKTRLTPCLYHGGIVIVAPSDSEELMALDALSGSVLWKRTLGDRIRHLLGVADGRLIVSGNQLWGLDVETGRVQWRLGYTDPSGHGYGRGLLAGDLVYWPLREEIFLVSQSQGTIERRVALKPVYGQTGGNLLIAGGRLVIAGPEELVVFGNPDALSRARERSSSE